MFRKVEHASAPIDPLMYSRFEKRRKLQYIPATRTIADERAELLKAISDGDYKPMHPKLFNNPDAPFGTFTDIEVAAERKRIIHEEISRVLRQDRDRLLDTYEYPADPLLASELGLYRLQFGRMPYDQDLHQNPCTDIDAITRAVYDREHFQIVTYGTSPDPVKATSDLKELLLIHGKSEGVEVSEHAA